MRQSAIMNEFPTISTGPFFCRLIFQSFQPRDIVVAKVISLGDASAYLLTTAENELGVIVAYPSSSTTTETPMMPISWCEVFCPSTGVKELRKVAKPQPQYLTVRE